MTDTMKIESRQSDKEFEPISFQLNGQPVKVHADPVTRLSTLLREAIGQTGTKSGCDAGDCGACSVLLDGEVVCACMVPSGRIAGAEITTVEGLGETEDTARLQRAFHHYGAAQCGICTPGILVAAKDLLERNPDPTEKEIRFWLAGNLCRCTGYDKIIRAVQDAAAEMRGA